MGEILTMIFEHRCRSSRTNERRTSLQCSQTSEQRHLPIHRTAESCSQYHSMWVAPSRTCVSVSSRLE